MSVLNYQKILFLLLFCGVCQIAYVYLDFEFLNMESLTGFLANVVKYRLSLNDTTVGRRDALQNWTSTITAESLKTESNETMSNATDSITNISTELSLKSAEFDETTPTDSRPYTQSEFASLNMPSNLNETGFRNDRPPSHFQKNRSKTKMKDILVSSGHVTPDDIPMVKVEAVNCAKLIAGNSREQEKADRYHEQEHLERFVSDEELKKQASNCQEFLSNRSYIVGNVSDEELEFPIAFSILMYTDVELFERLLRAIYRPQNIYCVQVDKKSSKFVQEAVIAIVNCLENVFLAAKQYDVQWGGFSVLEPEISCMKDLLKYKKWKYLINLTGQEFPLKTNWEIVQILKAFNGANNMEGTIKRKNKDRDECCLPAPFNITTTKGSVHIIASRGYVEYVIENETAIQFLDWVSKTIIPDETFFSTLNFNPHLGVPGSYKGIPETDMKKNLFVVRYKAWGAEANPFYHHWTCGGMRVRSVCVFGVRDLPLLANRFELFANKFFLRYQPLTLDCMEELIFNRTRSELSQGPKVDRKFYADLDFVKDQVKTTT